jgi:DNA repair protein RecO
MEEKFCGIVLGGVSFGENDKILKVFTLEKGVISAKIKGVKKAGAKLKFASEPFCFAEFIFTVRGEMRTVIGASLIDSFYPIRENIHKYFAGGGVLEFVKRFYKENIAPDAAFFDTVDVLKKLAYGDDDYLGALIRYLAKALKESGYSLHVDGRCECGNEIEGRTFFDYRSGAFFCEKCFDGVGREINNKTLKALIKVMAGEAEEYQNKVKVIKLLDYYIENRVEESLSSLKELIKIL